MVIGTTYDPPGLSAEQTSDLCLLSSLAQVENDNPNSTKGSIQSKKINNLQAERQKKEEKAAVSNLVVLCEKCSKPHDGMRFCCLVVVCFSFFCFSC